MISQVTIYYFITMIAIGILAPIGIWALYVLVKKEKITTVLVGAATFLVFAIILESFPKALIFQIPSPLSRLVLGNPWLYSIVGALMAGVFEETGRFISFKFLLKNRNTKTTSVAFGLGHGLFEVMFLFVMQGFQYLMYAFMINAGTFNTVIAQVSAVSPDQAEALASLPKLLAATTFATLPLALWERAFAVVFHVGASILVFYSVKAPGKKWVFPLAILLHTLLDIIAGLGQTGVLSNVYVIEGCITVFSAIMFILCYLFVYKKMPNDLSGGEMAE